MSRHLQNEFEKLKKAILSMAGVVEEAVLAAVRSLQARDRELARRVIEGDARIDDQEVEIEEECLKVLALHQPVAADLRFVIAVLKINNDLERIADLAVNLAERAAYLVTQPPIEIPFDLGRMAEIVRTMLKSSLDALVSADAAAAMALRLQDDDVDKINREAFLHVEERIRQDPAQTYVLMHCLSVARHLERIADLATNIAEDVIYMVTGQIVRHRPEDYSRLHQQLGTGEQTDG